MPFPRKLLNEGEEIVLDLRPHWWFLAGPIFWLVIAIAATIAADVVFPNLPGPVWLGGLALIGLMLLWLVGRTLRWTTTNFVVTTDRLVFRSGVIAKSGKEIPLERINDLGFKQSIPERLMGAGDLIIESAGERGQEYFNKIPRPARVQNEIYRQIELSKGRDADRMAGRRELSAPEQLEKLDELRQRGVISQAEFDAKKQQLLDRM